MADMQKMSVSEKTAGQVLREKLAEIAVHLGVNTGNELAAAVIAHVRPQIEAEAKAAAIEDVILQHRTESIDGGNQWWEKIGYVRIRALATAPAGHVCVPVDAIESIAEDKIFPDSGFSEEYIRGYNDACSEHYDELKDYVPARPK